MDMETLISGAEDVEGHFVGSARNSGTGMHYSVMSRVLVLTLLHSSSQ